MLALGNSSCLVMVRCVPLWYWKQPPGGMTGCCPAQHSNHHINNYMEQHINNYTVLLLIKALKHLQTVAGNTFNDIMAVPGWE